jgi:hypothetical protein
VLGSFFSSEAALKFLGLPGLVLLLAYLFYRGLLNAKIIKPLTSRQGFILLMAIVTYFAGATVLFAVLYRPVSAPAAAATPAAATPAPEQDKLATLLKRARLTTPIEAFAAAMGPAISIRGNRFADGVKDYLFEDDGGSKLPIPSLHIGWGDTDVVWDDLSDLTLATALAQCEDQHGVDTTAMIRSYFVGPCYFGRPGEYKTFTFLFAFPEDLDHRCIADLNADETSFDEAWVAACKIGNLVPVGFVVAEEEASIEPARLSLLEVAFGGGG